MDFRADLEHDPENYYHENKVYFKFLRETLLKTSFKLLIVSVLIGLILLSQYMESKDLNTFFSGLFTFIFLVTLATFYNVIRFKKEFQKNLDRIAKIYKKNPKYSIWITEEVFGIKHQLGSFENKWSTKTTLKILDDILILDTYNNRMQVILINKKEVGEEKFEEIVLFVREKLDNIKFEDSEDVF